MTPFVPTDTQVVDVFADAVAIDSPSGNESGFASFLSRTALAWGAECHIDAVGNVHARFGNPRPGEHMMFMSHMDTVDVGAASHRVTPTAVYGRGSVDAKGPLVAMLAACARAQETVSSHWVAVVEEETIGSAGAEHLRACFPAPSAVVVGEPTGVDRVGIGYKGKADVHVSVTTPATHSTWPHAHASEVAVAALSDLQQAMPPTMREQFDSLSVAVLAADLGLHRSDIELGYRLPPGCSPERAIKATETAFAQTAANITLIHHVPAATMRRSDWLPRTLGGCVAQVTGQRPHFVKKTATCDMNTLAQSWNVPMVVYGPGNSALDHADDEHQLIADMHTSVAVLTHLLQATTVKANP